MSASTHAYSGTEGGYCQVQMPDGDRCGSSPHHTVHDGRSRYYYAVAAEAKFEKPTEAVSAFIAHSDAVLQLVREKDLAYGGAWKKQGYMGNLARIMSKTARLENMLWRDDESNGIGVSVGGESVADTLHDLMALAAFMLTNFEDGNRWGS